MKKKVLFVAHMDSHIANFHLPYLKWFQENGYETHVASNNLEKTKDILYCDYKHQINFNRSPFSLSNIKVYKEFKKLIKEHDFSLVHAHTPMGGIISRLAFRKSKTPIIYTAHGFHFLKGGSKLSWLLFYPVEKFLSRYTDLLITINEEDYRLAKSKFSKKCKIILVNGVGVDLTEYKKLSNDKLVSVRNSLGLKESDFVLVYVAELTTGKNQGFLINAVNKFKDKYPNLKLLLIGYGKEEETYKKMINDLLLNDFILQLGYRRDIIELTNIADLVVSSSLREGLPRALLEALSIGKPLLVSDVRGNRDVVNNGENGYLYPKNDFSKFEELFEKLYFDKDLRDRFKEASSELSKKFDLNVVLDQVSKEYVNFLKDGVKNE